MRICTNSIYLFIKLYHEKKKNPLRCGGPLKISENPTRLFLYQLPHTAAFLPTLGFLSSLNGSVKRTA